MKGLLLLLVMMSEIVAVRLLIDLSGAYGVGQHIVVTPSGNDSIIKIDANDVVLDLENYIIEQSGGSGTLNGIEIASGRSNITILNGIIRNVSGSGIFINQNCSNITVDNIQILGAAIGFNLSSSANNPIIDCNFLNTFINNVTNQAFFVGPECANIMINNAYIDNCATNTVAILFSGAATNRNTSNTINNVTVSRCGSGVQLLNTDNSLIQNSRVLHGLTTASYTGFYIVGESGNQANGNVIKNCSVEEATAGAAGFIHCFRLEQASRALISNCVAKVDASTTTSTVGFYTITSNNSVIEDCTVPVLQGINQALGFRVENCQEMVIRDSEALSVVRTSTAGIGATDGFNIFNSTFVSVLDCVSTANSDDGYSLASDTSAALRRCIASNHTFNSFISTSNIACIYDTCISNNIIDATGNGFRVADTDTLLINCKSLAALNRGFGFDATAINCAVQDSIALECTNGFRNENGATGTILNSNVATNCTTGFFQGGAIGTNRFFLNKATNNITNYSVVIPATYSQNQNARQGGNLDY